MAKFFFNVFAQNNDLTTTPDTTQANGSVSYYNGYGPFYELPLPGGGSAIALNRLQFNGLINDITGAIQQIQTQGVFSWIGPSPYSPLDYTGNYPYPINALVYYTDGNLYQSQKANNQDVPGVSGAAWTNLSVNPGGVPVGTVIDFMGRIPPTNYLACNVPNTAGNGIARATYPALLASITVTQSGTTAGSSATVAMTNTSGIAVGDAVESRGTTNVPANTTVAAIVANTSITLSQNATGSGTQPLQFFPWGNGDGSTTFYLPYLSRRETVGAGGAQINGPGTTVGSYGGVEQNALTQANLPTDNMEILQNGVPLFALNAGTVPIEGIGATAGGATPTVTYVQLNLGSQTPLDNFSPSAVSLKCIKYQ